MHFRYLTVILLILIWITSSPAQEIVEVVQIEKDDGLKDRTVDRIIRDQNGYFILFMLNTIQKYDGKTFENIDVSAIKSNKLTVRNIEKVDILNDGTIILHIPDIDILFYIQNKQNRVSHTTLKGHPIVNQGKLYLLKPDGLKSEKHLLHKAELTTNLTSEYLSGLELEEDVQQLAIIDNLIYLQKEDLSIQLLNDNQLIDIPKKGKLIQRENGIYLFSQDKIYKLLGPDVVEVALLKESSYACNILKLDAHQNIVAAYTGRPRFHDRVYVLDKNDSLHVMDNIVEVSDVFKDFYTDDAFHRWMLGGYNGLHIINLLRDGAKIIHKRNSTKKGEFGIVISGVASDADNEIIYTRENEGIFSYDNKNNEFSEKMQKFSANGDFKNNSKLYFNKSSNTYFSYAFRYDGKSDIYQTNIDLESINKYVVPFKLNDIYPIDENNILFGGYITKTSQGILGTYDIKNRTYKVIRQDTREIRSITFDKISNTYWIGTYQGLHVMDTDFNTIALFDREKSGHEFMAQDHIVMTSRFQKWIIAGSYGGGIYVIDPVEYKIIKKIDDSDGLNDNVAIGIINDDLGHCWITTFNGVSVLDSNLQVIQKIYEHHGLPNREFNSKAIAKDGNGNIYAGTLNGVSMLNPSKVLQWQKSYQIDIKSIIGYKGKIFERLDISPEIPLYEAYDSLILNYNLPDYHHYPYVKENIGISIDGEMDHSIDENRIILKNFTTGEYKLSISLAGNPKNTELRIVRHSNFKRTASIFSIALAMALLAWLVSKQIIRANKIRENEKTKLNKRIADLQLSSLQSQMNPHFIFNALGSIQYFIQTYDTVKADEFLSNFAMLMRSILESSKSKYITLNEEIKLLNLYVGLEEIRFETLFEYKIDVTENLDLENKIPPMIIQPFVENAINHGLYHLKGRKGLLTLKFESLNADNIMITITDNGIGRKAASELRSKSHKSRGMQIIGERLETINQSQELKIKVTVTDIEKEGRANGTEVVVIISETG